MPTPCLIAILSNIQSVPKVVTTIIIPVDRTIPSVAISIADAVPAPVKIVSFENHRMTKEINSKNKVRSRTLSQNIFKVAS